MRFAAIKFVSLMLSGFLLMTATHAQLNVDSICPCPTPPGGTCKCEPGQIAICKVVNGSCAGTCLTRRSDLNDAQNTVRLAEAITGLSAKEIGFDQNGRRTNETLSADTLRMLGDMFGRKQGQTLFDAELPPRYRLLNPTSATPLVQQKEVKVNLVPEVAASLDRGLRSLSAAGVFQ